MQIERAGGDARCNIGPAEIARRRQMAIGLTVVSVIVVVLLVAIHAPVIARGILWPLASAAAVTWLQVMRRFCVRFGMSGLQNLGPIGSETPVARAQRDKDRKQAQQMIFEGLLAGLLATVAFYNLPL
jgi:hypothetical protein